jgi:hypothetical protein
MMKNSARKSKIRLNLESVRRLSNEELAFQMGGDAVGPTASQSLPDVAPPGGSVAANAVVVINVCFG